MAELAQEQALFSANVEEWVQGHTGDFVLIKGTEVVGFYPSLQQAFAEGSKRFGLTPFFVKQIIPANPLNVSFFGAHLLSA